MANDNRPTFASFWAGLPPSPFELACFHSFYRRDYDLVVYSYDTFEGMPDWLRFRDAGEITDRADLELYIYDGKPNLSHFSDLFRYRLFQETDRIWVDADILLMQPFDFDLPASIFAKEHETSLCAAVMRLDRSDPRLAELVARTRALAGKSLFWGETGPRLMTAVFGKTDAFKDAFPPSTFYPVLYDVFWKVFLPEHRDECEAMCQDGYTLHLWNNIVVQLGVWKELAPPQGSFLYELFERDDSLGFFRGSYPAPVMRRMVENWRLRFTGADVGLGNLARQLYPSALRTAKRRGWLRT
jgi:Alpha 1,4-glycosyltransferase conserved region